MGPTHVVVSGGATEPKPWEATSDRGVYLHVRERWVAPRRWVRYDGAPEDLALAAVCAVPGLLVFEASVRRLTLAALVVGVGYAVVRKRVPQLSGRFPGFVARLPGAVAVAVAWLTLGLVGRFGRR